MAYIQGSVLLFTRSDVCWGSWHVSPAVWGPRYIWAFSGPFPVEGDSGREGKGGRPGPRQWGREHTCDGESYTDLLDCASRRYNTFLKINGRAAPAPGPASGGGGRAAPTPTRLGSPLPRPPPQPPQPPLPVPFAAMREPLRSRPGPRSPR